MGYYFLYWNVVSFYHWNTCGLGISIFKIIFHLPDSGYNSVSIRILRKYI